MPFPLVTTFETTGTYKKWLWPNSAYITYTWHALLLWHTYLHTYIYIYIYIYIRTASAQICTPLIVSCSLANYGRFFFFFFFFFFPASGYIGHLHGRCIWRWTLTVLLSIVLFQGTISSFKSILKILFRSMHNCILSTMRFSFLCCPYDNCLFSPFRPLESCRLFLVRNYIAGYFLALAAIILSFHQCTQMIPTRIRS